MNVAGIPYRTIRLHADGVSVEVIDQTLLPHEFRLVHLHTLEDAVRAIADMVVRGAPLIGATAAYGMALALRQDPAIPAWRVPTQQLLATRPTAVNLRWAVDENPHGDDPVHPRNAPRPPFVARRRSARKTWPCVRPLASTASASSKPSPSARDRVP